MNDNDKRDREFEVDLVIIKKDMEVLHNEMLSYIETLQQWKAERVERVNDMEDRFRSIDKTLNELTNRLNLIESKQTIYIKRGEERAQAEEEYKKAILETQRANKAIWIPIIFSSIITLLTAILPLIF